MDIINRHILQVTQGLSLLYPEEIEKAVSLFRLVRKWGGRVYLFGNGGSAALASHFTNDLIKMGRVRAMCLTDGFPVASAYGNDEGWMNMYLNQLKVLFDKERDCAVGITCSGKSENVIRALSWIHGMGGLVLGLTGLAVVTPIHQIGEIPLIHAPVPDIRVQEDLHAVACHAIARELVEDI